MLDESPAVVDRDIFDIDPPDSDIFDLYSPVGLVESCD